MQIAKTHSKMQNVYWFSRIALTPMLSKPGFQVQIAFWIFICHFAFSFLIFDFWVYKQILRRKEYCRIDPLEN